MTFANVIFVGLTIAYPFIVYLGIGHLEPRILALILLIVFGTRYLIGRRAAPQFATWTFFGLASFAVAAFAMGSQSTLYYYPVVINVILFVLFAHSIAYPPTVIEQIARIREPELPPSGVVYTRKVTFAWLLFFLVNGSIALATAIHGDVAVWSLYNGFVAYLLMGALFLVELLIRRRVRHT
jgi:uncharacterized membrane protein